MGLSINQIKMAIQTLWDRDIPVMIHGPPGVGKSAAVKQLAAEMAYHVPTNDDVVAVSSYLEDKLYGREFSGRKIFDIRLMLCSPTDLKGIPVFDTEDRSAVWVMTGLFPMDPRQLKELERELVELAVLIAEDPTNFKLVQRFSRLERKIEQGWHDQFGIIFLDEISAAPQSVMTAAFSLVLDREIGTYRLPQQTRLVAAGNRAKDRAGANKMLSALVSRFAHLHLDNPSADEWVAWAEETGQDTEIISFIKFNPQQLFVFDPKVLSGDGETSESNFRCPRTWEFASRVKKSNPLDRDETADIFYEIISGIVGQTGSIEFRAWKTRYRTLPDPNEVLDGKITYDDVVPKFVHNGKSDMSLEYAYIHDMLKALKDSFSIDRGNRFVDYMLADPSKVEWITVALKRLFDDKQMQMFKCPRFKDLLKAANMNDMLFKKSV